VTKNSDDTAPDSEPSEPEEGPQLTGTEELEAALREALESKEARDAGGEDADAGDGMSMDKMTIVALSNELRELKQAFEEREAELEAAKERHLRLQAEFENFRRRSLKEKQETALYGPQNLVKDLLTTVDNLERAIEHSEQSGDADLKSLLQGVQLVQRELLAGLANHGVVVVEAEGQPFDPAVHEAMGQAPTDDVPPNTVVEVLQKGYMLRDRLLRPARVIVSAPAAGGSGG
jgi:molecular chaperone GrpE